MKFTLLSGDITKVEADAIVNAANVTLLGGGGVDGAIHRAAGPKLLAECVTLMGCKTGEAKVTKAYRLPAKFVIHTPGPRWLGGRRNEEQLLANSYRNCLKLAAEKQCRTVAFPSISTGIFHFPLDMAAAIAIREILTFPEGSSIEEVMMVCFDKKTLGAYELALENWKKRAQK
ncbi:MAG: O-acetyl-ADP-ribose deacetylase [Thermoguttaceae bacterium]|nr:O-acetyl-ADP-ribose deacetylase [Planctomycetaceae bacterium]MBQ4141912.1 O-acetyl-ADP-ribose deacetylase [Thermoguttaceae bacterium]